MAFYRDLLRFEIYRSWDRESDRGTMFRSPDGAGLIGIEAGDPSSTASRRLYIEVNSVAQWYENVHRPGVPVLKELGATNYGHRNFQIADPNGVEVCFFEYLKPSADRAGAAQSSALQPAGGEEAEADFAAPPALCVIYRWKLRPGLGKRFAAAWERVTQLLM